MWGRKRQAAVEGGEMATEPVELTPAQAEAVIGGISCNYATIDLWRAWGAGPGRLGASDAVPVEEISLN